METQRTIFQRKIKEFTKEIRRLREEANDIPDVFAELYLRVKYERKFILSELKVDVMNITANSKLRNRGTYKKGTKSKIHKYRPIVEHMIFLKKREVEIKDRIKYIYFVKRNLSLYSTTINMFFDEFVNQILRGIPYMSMGNYLSFYASVGEVDNSDGKKRLDKHGTQKNIKRLLSEGVKLNDPCAGIKGEEFAVFHDNVIRLSSIKFSKSRCRVENVKWYKFIPTHFNKPGKDGIALKDYKIDSMDDIFYGNFSTRNKLRLIDINFPEFRDTNYIEFIKYGE